jgi:hypothetical protein
MQTAVARAGSPRGPSHPPPERAVVTRTQVAAAVVVFALLALAVYAPSLHAPFYSDDNYYVVGNEYVQDLSASKLRTILSPTGAPVKMTLNYAPVHLLAYSLQFRFFELRSTGYHVVNVLVHSLGSVLLVALFLRSGIPRLAALGGALWFLLHTANVEAVAWISQLKTSLALLLAVAALLLHPKRPAAGLLLFGLALLTKALAAFALPVALLFEWTDRRPSDAPTEGPSKRSRWLWLVAWGVLFAVCATLEFPVFRYMNADVAPVHPDPLVQARTIMAIATRYLAMASTSYGVGAFQEVAPAESWLDPWWLASIPVLALLGFRMLRSLLARRQEGVYWAWAAISFAPISQVFPFLYPMADHYLYFILPGLIGGVLLATQQWVSRSEWVESHPGLGRLGVAAAVLVLALFTAHTYTQTKLWRHPALVDAQAVERHPDGLLAHIVWAKRAAASGDAETSVAALRFAVNRGHIPFQDVLWGQHWAPVRPHPEFQALLRELASKWIDLKSGFPMTSQLELSWFAQAHMVLEEYEQAQILLERALELGGLRDDEIRMDLARVRRLRAEAERRQGPRGDGDSFR